MTKICTFLDRVSNMINKAARVILLICGTGILFSMTCGIFSRSLLPRSFMWPEEVSRYLLIWVCFVGASVALHNRDLIRFEFIINLFKGKAYTAVELLGNVLSLIFLVFFTKIGIGLIPYYLKAMGTTVPIKMIWPANRPAKPTDREVYNYGNGNLSFYSAFCIHVLRYANRSGCRYGRADDRRYLGSDRT